MGEVEKILGEKRVSFNKKYDDPYRLLAAHILGYYDLDSVYAIYTNKECVKHLILAEARRLDIAGPFLDCIDQCVIAGDCKRSKNKALNELGEFYYQNLDLARLRKSLVLVANELGIDLANYTV